MFCPRCGARNEEGDRYCVSCGASLRPSPTERLSLRERLARMIGTTRRARLLTLGTIAAIVIAVVAWLSLPTDDDSADDPFTVAADAICVNAKQQIAAARARLGTGPDAVTSLVRAMVPIIVDWREEYNDLAPPSDRGDQAGELSAALQEVEFAIAALARVSRDDGPQAVLQQAGRADRASVRVEEAIVDLGLPQCGSLALGVTPGASSP